MESFVNDYYNQIGKATSEAERAQIKAEFAAKLQTFPEEQRQQVKALVGDRLNAFLETLTPIDSVIEQFKQIYHLDNN